MGISDRVGTRFARWGWGTGHIETADARDGARVRWQDGDSSILSLDEARDARDRYATKEKATMPKKAERPNRSEECKETTKKRSLHTTLSRKHIIRSTRQSE